MISGVRTRQACCIMRIGREVFFMRDETNKQSLIRFGLCFGLYMSSLCTYLP
jgi:hypothetical protein